MAALRGIGNALRPNGAVFVELLAQRRVFGEALRIAMKEAGLKPKPA